MTFQCGKVGNAIYGNRKGELDELLVYVDARRDAVPPLHERGHPPMSGMSGVKGK